MSKISVRCEKHEQEKRREREERSWNLDQQRLIVFESVEKVRATSQSNNNNKKRNRQPFKPFWPIEKQWRFMNYWFPTKLFYIHRNYSNNYSLFEKWKNNNKFQHFNLLNSFFLLFTFINFFISNELWMEFRRITQNRMKFFFVFNKFQYIEFVLFFLV